jgi:hypothetical protein
MLIDLVSGYFWYLKLIRRAPIRPEHIDPFVEVLLHGIAAPQRDATNQ